MTSRSLRQYTISTGIYRRAGRDLGAGDQLSLTEVEAQRLARWHDLTFEELESEKVNAQEASESVESEVRGVTPTYHQLLAYAASQGFLEESGRSRAGIEAYMERFGLEYEEEVSDDD